ncbi:MAG: hypothetical protein JWM82_1352 [Myxococcales bacterium]|nr:hypothetical protein [Myxococcales bacterium]
MSPSSAAKSGLPFVALFLSAALAACSGSKASGNDGAAGGAGATGTAGATAGAAGATGNPDAVVGAFAIKFKTDSTPSIAAITGTVYDAPTFQPLFAAAMKDGDCTLEKPVFPFCAPACDADTADCVADDTCRARPGKQNVGAVTLTDVKTAAGGTSLVLEPTNNIYQPSADTAPAYPPFDEGVDVGLTATGGAYGAFEIHAKGIAPLVFADETLTLERDKTLTLHWTPKGASSDATIQVRVDISHHGGLKGLITCETADTGTLTISAALTSALRNLGVAGFPAVLLTRTSKASTKIAPGRVELVLSHAVEHPLVIPGLTSCGDMTNSSDCPTGKLCKSDSTCQ